MKTFKTEKARQDYYKQLHLQNNQIAQKNDDKLTEAYHEIEFGVIPQISDNRSLAEKLADDRLNQDQAQKNALMLMANDGSETSKLLNLIGTARYGDFNRYFLDIFNSLKGQIGKIESRDAYVFIDRYITKASVTYGVDIPNVEILDQLISVIHNNMPSQTGDVRDMVLRLEALEQVLITTGNFIDQIEYNTRGLPTKDDIQKMLDTLAEDAPGDPSLTRSKQEIIEELRRIVGNIDSDSLESVISGISQDDKDDDNTIESIDGDNLKDDDPKDDGTVQTSESIKLSLDRLKQGAITKTEIGQNIKDFMDAYNYVVNNIDDDNTNVETMKKNIKILYEASGVSRAGLPNTTKIDSLREKFETNKPQIERVFDHLNKKIGEPNMAGSSEREAIENIDNHLATLLKDEKQEFSDDYIRKLNRLRRMVLTNKDNEDTLDGQDADDYAFIIKHTRNIDGRRSASAKKYKNLGELNQIPYTTVYDHLSNKYGEPKKQAQPKPETEPGSNIHGMQDLVAFEEQKTGTTGKGLSGNGSRKNRMFNKRVY